MVFRSVVRENRLRALFSDPTRLKVVAVVVDRNQSEQKLMRKPHSADMDAASWKPWLNSAGSDAMRVNSPLTRATKHSSGSDSTLLKYTCRRRRP